VTARFLSVEPRGSRVEHHVDLGAVAAISKTPTEIVFSCLGGVRITMAWRPDPNEYAGLLDDWRAAREASCPST